MRTCTISIAALAMIIASCSAAPGTDSTSEPAARPATNAPPITTTVAEVTPTTADTPGGGATADPAAVAATCEALATERATGREAALDAWDEARRALPITERFDPIEAACGELLANHRAATALINRNAEFDRVGFRGGLSACLESPVEMLMVNGNDFTVDVLAIAFADGDGMSDGWAYVLEPGVYADEERPITIPWITPRPGEGCGVRTRSWLTDSSSATATLHEAGDPPDAELPSRPRRSQLTATTGARSSPASAASSTGLKPTQTRR